MTRYQQASHLANYYLQRMSLEGRLSITDENNLISDFNKISLTVNSIEGPKESAGNPRVLRKPEDPINSTITLRITATPTVEPLWIGKLIGGNTAGGSQIVVGGETLSERYTP
ncbi:MAG: hypothetical protein H0Z24_03540 [Thermosipho sp. (in: Bacteria)]|nr:hypothetical protein [Thermosipho sp. (in: thermotogales)]